MDFLKTTLRKSNITIWLYLAVNVFMIAIVFWDSATAGEHEINYYVILGFSFAAYIASLASFFSPIGE